MPYVLYRCWCQGGKKHSFENFTIQDLVRPPCQSVTGDAPLSNWGVHPRGFWRTSNLHFRPPYQPHQSTYNGTFVSLYAYLWYDHNCLIGIARNNHALDHLLLRKLKAVILRLFDKNLDSFGMTYESWVYALDFESRPCLEWLLQRFIQVRWSPLT